MDMAPPPGNSPPSGSVQRRPSIKERVENNLIVYFLGTLLTGFLSGVATYQGALKLVDYSPVPQAEYSRLKALAAEPRQSPQRWLRIKGIDGISGSDVRIVARVNGRTISYPSRTVWSQARPGMPIEEFALSNDLKTVELSFEVLAISQPSGRYQEYRSQEVISIAQFPAEGEYKVFGVAVGPAGASKCAPSLPGMLPTPCPVDQSGQVRVAFEVR